LTAVGQVAYRLYERSNLQVTGQTCPMTGQISYPVMAGYLTGYDRSNFHPRHHLEQS